MASVAVPLRAEGRSEEPEAPRGDPNSDRVEILIDAVAVRPQDQVFSMLALFEGSGWPHPAAVLADWKRAAKPGEIRTLGKPLEALIAAFNPLTARELQALDGLRVGITRTAGEAGSLRWSVTLPRDDGTLEAAVTAMALTEGRREAPWRGVPIDRLGPPDGPLAAAHGPVVVFASDRQELIGALERLEQSDAFERPNAAEPGWIVRLAPSSLQETDDLALRRLGAGLAAIGYDRPTEARLMVQDDRLELRLGNEGRARDEVETRDDPNRPEAAGRTIDPRWLDVVPVERASAAASVAVGPGGHAWNAAIEAIDRIERADPDRADAAPWAVRLALLSAARGVRLDRDLWPVLEGATAWTAISETGAPEAIVVALHATDAVSARRARERVVARLVGGLEGADEADDAADGRAGAPFGTLAGRPLSGLVVGSTLVIGWGDAAVSTAQAALEGREPGASALLDGARTHRWGAVWPGRWPTGLEAGPSRLKAALWSSSPIVWIGPGPDRPHQDRIRWKDLKRSLQAVLEAITDAEEIPRRVQADVRPDR